MAESLPTTTLLLNAVDVALLMKLDDVSRVVHDAFCSLHRGEAQMPPKSYVYVPEYQGDFRSMPARVGDASAVKWVNVHPNNPAVFGIPSVQGMLILGDNRTGFPLAVMDATLLTSGRTAASAAVATRALARPDARTLGIVGAGGQAPWQLSAVVKTRPFHRVLVADVREEAARDLVERVRARRPGFGVETASIEEAAGCDVLITVTPVKQPVILREWIRPGTHINAMGADAPGKQELDPRILNDSRVFVDEWEQAQHSGEINVPLTTGQWSRERLAGTLGAVLCNGAPGRISDRDITVFDSTGLAIQDAVVGRLVYEAALERGVGTPFRFQPGDGIRVPDVLRELSWPDVAAEATLQR